eukprot:SAG11_NODE_268_length_11447_cov_3.136135_10_plen_51_part_00
MSPAVGARDDATMLLLLLVGRREALVVVERSADVVVRIGVRAGARPIGEA